MARKQVVFCLAILIVLYASSNVWGWASFKWGGIDYNDHGKLAVKTEKCVPLPKPSQKKCEKPVDDSILYKALKLGSKEPDDKDGDTSPKHSYNPAYPDDKHWDPAIRVKVQLPNAQINAGTALSTIETEKAVVKKQLQSLSCDSGKGQYEKVWKQFGRLSHYSSDMASPLHAYSVSVNGVYLEGDYLNAGWIKGLYDIGGKTWHWRSEISMGEAIDGISCNEALNIGPGKTAENARLVLNNYTSAKGHGYGFPAMIKDYETYPNGIRLSFFKDIGSQQVKDGIGVIKNVWKDALTGFAAPSGCDKPPTGGCGDCGGASCQPPGGETPDDNFSVSTLSTPPTSDEILEQVWDRMAVKKDRKSLIWFWMQSYLNGEYLLGNIDKATYDSRSKNYGLTSESAWELFYNDYITTPDVAILGRGFALSMSDLMQGSFNEPVRRFTVEYFAPDALKNYPVFVIPSGGLMGLENSAVFKASLDEYVKQGGTLVVFAQQHGYEFSALPVPQETDGTHRNITGYGWTEDQSCFANAAFIDTWHQMLASVDKTTPTLSIDGYFTEYPSNTTVLLRRTANGQPAMITYDHGLGKVVVTSMYSDFALKSNQASSEEIALVRDMIAWAKKPAVLPEVKPGETVSISLETKNNTTLDAASVKVTVYSPDRTTLLSEQTILAPVPAGLSLAVTVSYASILTSVLGIYHIDYELYDADGNIIQPQAETDSGRFVVSNPPMNPYKSSNLNFAINSDSEQYAYGSDATFTVTAWNNTDADRSIAARACTYHLDISGIPSCYGGGLANATPISLNVPAHSSASFQLVATNITWEGWLVAIANDETGVQVGYGQKGIWMFQPSVNVSTIIDKPFYARGETVTLAVKLQNTQKTGYTTTLRVGVSDPSNKNVYYTTQNIILGANATSTQSIAFTLPTDAQVGFYIVSVEAYDSNGNKIGNNSSSFELPQSLISVTPMLPLALSPGSSSMQFVLNNNGKIPVSSGVFDVCMIDPDGEILFSTSQSFVMAVGENKILNVPISIPSLKFGDYILTFTQSDETRIGKPTSIAVANNASIAFSFDKTSYKIRETANLTLDLASTGKFVLENSSVTVTVPEANYAATKTINIGQGSNEKLQFSIPIPGTATEGLQDVYVTITLPDGNYLTEYTSFAIPGSTLVGEYSGQSNIMAGDTIHVTIENTGGVDTNYRTDQLTVKDAKGLTIYSGNVAGTVLAGEKKTLLDLPISTQFVTGPIYIGILIRDLQTSRWSYLYKTLGVDGLTATLASQTDKQAYVNTEPITGLTNISNGQVGIENGNLELSVTQLTNEPIGEFLHFLPKKWSAFRSPTDVAITFDGSVYALDLNSLYRLDTSGNGFSKLVDSMFDYAHGVSKSGDGSIYVADTDHNSIKKYDKDGHLVAQWGTHCRTTYYEPVQQCNGNFREPMDVAISSDNFVYVADTFNNRIQKFNSNGNFISKWGMPGRATGQFSNPYGLAISSDGFIYIADSGNYRIQKFDKDGNFIKAWGNYCATSSNMECNGQFAYPWGIAIGADNYLYVTDMGNDRIQKFDSDGNFINKWGNYGPADGQFNQPKGIDISSDGYVYVADNGDGNGRIQKLDSSGNFIAAWYSFTSVSGQLLNPIDVAISPDRHIYVLNSDTLQVQKFDMEKNLITAWGGYGNADGQFENLSRLSVASDGSVYVVDTGSSCIQKFDSNGNFIGKWGSYGDGDGQFNNPFGIAIDSNGYSYIVDSGNSRVQKFDGNGNFIGKWGSYGNGNGQFTWPTDIAVSPNGYLYVADTYNNRIQKFDQNGNFISKWGAGLIAPRNIAISSDNFMYVIDRAGIEIQKFDINGNFIARWPYNYAQSYAGITTADDGSVYVADNYLKSILKMETSQVKQLYKATIPIDQQSNTTQTYSANVGTLKATGKLYLQGELKNNLGQTIAANKYPFYIFEGNTQLLFSTDKKYYKPNEAVTITGEVRNLAPIGISALNLQVSISDQNVYNAVIDIPANGSYPFTITTASGTEGTYFLSGTIIQNNSTPVEITDQYEVANPIVTAAVITPDVAGSEPFNMSVEIKNEGKVDASIQLSAINGQGTTLDDQQIILPAGETKQIQYTQQIADYADFIFMFAGDINQTITKTVYFGLSSYISLNPHTVYPEGKIGIPVTIFNTGHLGENLAIEYTLQPSGLTQTKTYYIPEGWSTEDTIHYDLAEGNYQITANSQLPIASSQANLAVMKENKVGMIVYSDYRGDVIPVTVNITNLGYNEISGSAQLSVINAQGTAAWNASQNVSLLANPQFQTPNLYTFNINPSTLVPGNYTLTVELLNNGNQQLAVSSQLLTIKGPVFQITQLPSYQTFTTGQEASFTFKLKNAGNREGSANLGFKAYDLINSTRTEWLNPGEEKTISFAFILPADLEAKDYFADYTLTPALSPSGEGVIKGQVKYHLAGINLNVNASLDKQTYAVGDTAHLTIAVSDQQAAGSRNLFVRVNYAGFENQQAFTLNGSTTLTFDIPLFQITGEKLFYGIYHESGRSIHLNSLYIYKAGDVITITTNKQVYNPGETVSVSVTGNATGSMTLTGPGYSETFDFSGTVSKSFVLPQTMTAGTYSIAADLATTDGQTYSAKYPIDIAGIQVKVLECKNDKGKYAASDTITTELTISSNSAMPAILKTWIVDPEGKYTATGETGINLNATDNALVSRNSALLTSVSGVHRLVYGIYSGDLLLVSGSEAFDVGDAVILGLKTDKTDYQTNTEAVKATATLYGSVSANVELQLDGTTVRNETTILDGFSAIEMELGSVTPGPHVLKGILTAGGLKSTRETSFVYGSNLPDLTPAISYQQSAISNDITVAIATTAANQGRTAAAPTTMALYDGDALIATKQVNGLNSGESQELVFVWNVLGKTGSRILKAVVDPDNSVIEFNEANNIATLNIEIPDLGLVTSTDKDTYKINQNVQISSSIRSLSSEKTFSSLTLITTAKDPVGNEVFSHASVITNLQPLSVNSNTVVWNTAGLNTDGTYTISQQLLAHSQVLAQGIKTVTLRKIADFAMSTDSDYKSIKQGEKATYTAHLEPLDGWSSGITLNLQGLPAGTSVSFHPDNLVPPGEALTVVITTDAAAAGKYTLSLVAEGIDEGERVTHALPLTLDVAGFALESMPAGIIIKQLETAIVDLNLTALNGYTGEVTLNISGLPHGVRTSVSNTNIQTPGNTQLTILTSKYVKPGIYTLTVTGDDGIVKHRQNITLNIQGNPDIAAGIITAQGPGPKNQAIVRVFDADGQPVFDLQAFITKYGANVTSADIDGDGYDEIIVAEGPDPKNPATLRAFRRNGALIAEYTAFDTKYGLTLASGDIDGDWKDELIVGMGPDPKYPATLKVLKYQGTGFIVLMSHTAYPGLKYGINTAVGDVDGDGLPEIITSPGPGPNNQAVISIWKQDGQRLVEFSTFTAFVGGYGVNITTGDIDGDGPAEIITGTGPDPKNPAVVRAFKADGTAVLEFAPYSSLYGYGVTVAAADIDSDGIVEIITGLGYGPQNPSWVKVFKADGSELTSFIAYPDNVKYGVKVYNGRAGK